MNKRKKERVKRREKQQRTVKQTQNPRDRHAQLKTEKNKLSENTLESNFKDTGLIAIIQLLSLCLLSRKKIGRVPLAKSL